MDGSQLVATFAANVEAAEGDLHRAPKAELDALVAAYGFKWFTLDKGLEGLGDRLGGKELWEYVLFLLVLLMFTEMFFAWKFGVHKK
jgi:hypothetical protein